MSAIALAILAAAMSWSASSTRLTYRSITIYPVGRGSGSSHGKGCEPNNRDLPVYAVESLVINNPELLIAEHGALLVGFRLLEHMAINDASGNIGQTYVQRGTSVSYISINPPLHQPQAFVSTYTVGVRCQRHCQSTGSHRGSSSAIATGPNPDFSICHVFVGKTGNQLRPAVRHPGPVHSNGKLYIEPDAP